MIGKGVLLECLDSDIVSEVLAIGRKSLNIDHKKLKELIISNFEDYSTIEKELLGYDACFYCLGISSAGMKEDAYHKITYSYTLALAKALYKINPGILFTYISGAGTDSSEKGSSMWARVKGKTENDLLKIGFKQAVMFRPGIIIPERGIRSGTKSYQLMYDNFMWLIKIIRLFWPESIVTTTAIGKAMIRLLNTKSSKTILDPKDILALSAQIKNSND